jgi:hypothetical protein
MQNVTIRIEGHLVARARAHAVKRGITLDQLLSDLVEHELKLGTTSRTRATFDLADRLNKNSVDGPMAREEAHSRD